MPSFGGRGGEGRVPAVFLACQFCTVAVTVVPGRAASNRACFLQPSRWFCAPPCDTVIYKKKYIFGLCPRDDSIKDVLCYVNEMIFGEPLGSLSLGAGCWRNQPCD